MKHTKRGKVGVGRGGKVGGRRGKGKKGEGGTRGRRGKGKKGRRRDEYERERGKEILPVLPHCSILTHCST